jgi:hypothetical protein
VREFSIRKYNASHLNAWNEFVLNSKNGTFLFDRRYMEYHADRFNDYSLLCLDDRDRLVALLPGSIKDGVVTSHGGLTYGGVICNSAMKAAAMLKVFASILEFMRRDHVRRLIYKAVPHIFHQIPAEEDLYALSMHNACLCRRDISSAIWLPDRLKFSKGKIEGIRKARRAGIVVRDSTDYASFFKIGSAVMQDRHNLQPVHTSKEMTLLADRFPGKILLHAAYRGEQMLAGAIVYRFSSSAHVQYMYNSDEGLGVGALDIVIDHLVNERYSKLRFLSFGVSTEDEGRHLNEGLIHQKEMFGARSIVHDFYEVDIS